MSQERYDEETGIPLIDPADFPPEPSVPVDKTQHTPGPWTVNEDGTSIRFDGGPNSERVLHPSEPRYPTKKELRALGDECNDDWFIASAGGHFCDRPTDELYANARLIAASPAMYAALASVLVFVDAGEQLPAKSQAVRLARAALKAVRGEDPDSAMEARIATREAYANGTASDFDDDEESLQEQNEALCRALAWFAAEYTTDDLPEEHQAALAFVRGEA